MYTTINPDGQLNNYAIEQPTYFAHFPTHHEQVRYLQQGAAALLLVVALFGIAVGVS
ncbi:photosystem II assembly protein Psb34 [Spirulina major]|uniref:photosystem II assembly protein Psb34 n=1 Tax=Spirulina major TaxID=270636 RepID=UPI001114C420|nr:ssl1498 family light-harvesting-like protein [Spirulina major]